jgi:hypothetical protein
MGLMTGSAGGTPVEALIAPDDLMTGAAIADPGTRVARMRIVATDASPRLTVLRMIRVDPRVAASASRVGAVLHGVGRVAALTVGVGVGALAGDAEGAYAPMALRAAHGLLLAECVWRVTGDALPMSAFEEGRLRHDGPHHRVTGHAGIEGLVALPVLALMTGRTDLGGGFTRGGVLGRDVGVALGAGLRARQSRAMRLVALQAVGASVDLYREGSVLVIAMTPPAVIGGRHGRQAPRGRRLAVDGEDVTGRAVCLRGVAEAGLRGRGRVPYPTLKLVTDGAAIGRWRSELSAGELVAGGAGDLVCDDVNGMPRNCAGRLPARPHVKAPSRRPDVVGLRGVLRARSDDRCREQRPEKEAQLAVPIQHARASIHFRERDLVCTMGRKRFPRFDGQGR